MWTTDAFTHFKMVERFKGPYLLRQKKMINAVLQAALNVLL